MRKVSYYNKKSFYKLLAEIKKQYERDTLNIDISIYPENCLDSLKAEIKHNLYRILQEAFANILKHAKANNVHLSFNKHKDSLVVIIEDDGIGFNVKTTIKGIGIKNMKERVTSINGEFNIDSSQKNGTQLIIKILEVNNTNHV